MLKYFERQYAQATCIFFWKNCKTERIERKICENVDLHDISYAELWNTSAASTLVSRLHK